MLFQELLCVLGTCASFKYCGLWSPFSQASPLFTRRAQAHVSWHSFPGYRTMGGQKSERGFLFLFVFLHSSHCARLLSSILFQARVSHCNYLSTFRTLSISTPSTTNYGTVVHTAYVLRKVKQQTWLSESLSLGELWKSMQKIGPSHALKDQKTNLFYLGNGGFLPPFSCRGCAKKRRDNKAEIWRQIRSVVQHHHTRGIEVFLSSPDRWPTLKKKASRFFAEVPIV